MNKRAEEDRRIGRLTLGLVGERTFGHMGIAEERRRMNAALLKLAIKAREKVVSK